MTPYPKRLIEVDLPIKKISEHSRREKSIRHGHISTLHIWWARRPLAACRAVICAALWPDPVDPLCPEKFKNDCSTIMRHFFDPMGTDTRDFDDPMALRVALLDFIADFANWDNSSKKEYLETSRAVTQSAHVSLGGAPGTKPLVVDPFAGGGSIPLEALRVGADAFASDLNPVAVLLNKMVLEYIPKHGQHLAEEVRKWGEWIKQEAEKELREFYPKDPDGSTPIAYLWARTIICEGPGCGAEVPLMRSLWLAKKKNRNRALRWVRDEKSNIKTERIEVTYADGTTQLIQRPQFEIFEPKNEKEVESKTTARGAATCQVCGFTTSVASVRRQLKARRGGTNDARLYAVVTTHPNHQGRSYRLPTEKDIEALRKAAEVLKQRKQIHNESLSLIPDEPTPSNKSHRAVSSVVIYGMEQWSDFFTYRQSLSLITLSRLIRNIDMYWEKPINDKDLLVAVKLVLAFCLDKLADLGNSLCPWEPVAECPRNLFARQAIPMAWYFGEGVPIGHSSGSFEIMVERFVHVLLSIGSNWGSAVPHQMSAIAHPLPDNSANAFITDPPYYDSVPYAELSDFFYVWLKRMVASQYPDLFQESVTNKHEQAIVWHPGSAEEKLNFEHKMELALSEGNRVITPKGIGIIVFAHKSTAGWESQLNALINAGWIITGSWPIDTEMGSRINARETASLASSIHLVCRPRVQGSESAIGDWRDVLQELPVRIHEWMPRLAQEKVIGADAIFACLGPALEIFSRYSKVEKASGEEVTLKVYLEYVWAAVAKEALGLIFQGADATGFEEDARLTAMWLWTLSAGMNGNSNKDAKEESDDVEEDVEASGKSSKISGYVLEYDAARKIAQGLGAHLELLSKLVEIKGDKARLLPVEERTIYLFGKEEIQAPKRGKKKEMKQLTFSSVLGEAEEEAGGWGEMKAPPAGKTVLDRVHQAMILFAAGRSDALKRFLVEDGIGKDERFWRLAQAFSALYPAGTDEKRWVEGLMAKKKGLGF